MVWTGIGLTRISIYRYAPEAKRAHEEGRGGLVHFDIEPSQIGRVINPTVAVTGDCKLAMEVRTIGVGGACRLKCKHYLLLSPLACLSPIIASPSIPLPKSRRYFRWWNTSHEKIG
jgi:hypothetical protein